MHSHRYFNQHSSFPFRPVSIVCQCTWELTLFSAAVTRSPFEQKKIAFAIFDETVDDRWIGSTALSDLSVDRSSIYRLTPTECRVLKLWPYPGVELFVVVPSVHIHHDNLWDLDRNCFAFQHVYFVSIFNCWFRLQLRFHVRNRMKWMM